jgi:hypothetical protein
MKQKVKIFVAILGAFCIARALNGTIFYANTPYLNRPYLESIASIPGVLQQRVLSSVSGNRSSSSETQRDEATHTTRTYTSRTYPTPQDQRGHELMAQGFSTAKPGVFQKQDVVAKSVTIEITDDVRYEKRPVTIDGQTVEAWVAKE